MASMPIDVCGGSGGSFSKYRVRPISGNQWEIVDEDGQVRFVGTPSECEELLDSAENPESRVSWIQSLVNWLLSTRESYGRSRRSRGTARSG